MQDFKYFTHSPADYALYQPVLGTFLIVMPESDHVMTRLAAVLSSRYLLQPVCIGVAENFTPTLIDNNVCEQWTLSNTQDLNARDILGQFTVIPVEQLVHTKPVINWDIDQEKRWAMMCLFWLRFINSLGDWQHRSGHWIEQVLKDALDLSPLGPATVSDLQQFEQKTLQLLYRGQDLESTDQQIIELVNNNKFLHHRWTNFSQGYQ